MLNKVFWLSMKNFRSSNSNKKLLGKEGHNIMSYIENFVDMLKYDYIHEEKINELEYYIN